MIKTKLLLYLITFIVASFTVHAQGLETLNLNVSMCDNPLKVGVNCVITTPTLNCSTGFTYDVINMSGNLTVDNGSLARLYDNVFFLNFTNTDDKNDFVIRLCDGSTQEVRVRGGDENLTNVAIAILLVGITFLLTKFALELDEKHWPLKLGLFGVVISMGWGIINMAVAFAKDVGAGSGVTTTLEGIFLGYTYLGLLVLGYIMIRMIMWTINLLTPKPELVTEQDREENEKGW